MGGGFLVGPVTFNSVLPILLDASLFFENSQLACHYRLSSLTTSPSIRTPMQWLVYSSGSPS